MKTIKLFLNDKLYYSNNHVTLIDIDVKNRKIIVEYNEKEYERDITVLGKTLFVKKCKHEYNTIIIYSKLKNNLEKLLTLNNSQGENVLEVYKLTKEEYLSFIHKSISSKYSQSDKVLKYKGQTDREKIKHMIAEDMSQYRKDECPSKAIALFKKIEPYFEKDEIDGPILVSLIAACLDVDNTSMAEKYLKQLQSSIDYKKYSIYINNLEKRLNTNTRV